MIKIYYNRSSIRLKNYDYSKNGMYYITICTHNREEILSKMDVIENVKPVGADDTVRPKNKIKIKYHLKLTQIGEIVNETWYAMLNIYDNIKLHEFVIMPDHIHGIIEICENEYYEPNKYSGRTGSSAPTLLQPGNVLNLDIGLYGNVIILNI